jgi:hypothetical protein
VWLVEVDGIPMEVLLFSRNKQRMSATSTLSQTFADVIQVLKFSDKKIRKHKDYKEIKSETQVKIRERYASHNQDESIYPVESI